MSWQRIRHLIRKEFIQLRRDPRMLRLVIVAPIVQLIIFGYAVTTDIKHIPTAVIDADRSRESRDLVARFSNTGYFEVVVVLERPQDLAPLMDNGRVQAGVHIPHGFAKSLARGESVPLQIIVDGTDSTTASMVLGYASGVLRRYAEEIMGERLQRLRVKLVRLPVIEERTRVWFNPELKSVNYMVPGVLCTILLIVTMVLTSMAIVREREIGTLEQIIVTPVRATELMAGKTIPFVLIGFVDMVLILLVATLWFRVPLKGSLLLLFALAVVFLLTTLGAGLFISTVSHTQQQAMMTAFFIMLPSILLSGFMFPIENMPRVIQWVTYLIPLRYFLNIVRGIFLKGVGLEVLWGDVLALLVTGLILFSLASLRFTKRMG
ncbi:MAG: transport permease protein [Armatimonadota bacterium]|nr:MAG: transport permease protein [Armatimonadota bacterium]